MSSPYEQCVASIRAVLAFYGSQSLCPCAFPRFVQLLQFHFRKYSVAPVGCHATDIAIALTTGKDGYYTRTSDTGDVTCRVCGSHAVVEWEQFSINMDVTWLTFKSIVTKAAGAAPADRIPMPAGFHGIGNDAIQRCAAAFCSEGSFDDMTRYLQASKEL